jgi:hypothetical protein
MENSILYGVLPCLSVKSSYISKNMSSTKYLFDFNRVAWRYIQEENILTEGDNRQLQAAEGHL